MYEFKTVSELFDYCTSLASTDSKLSSLSVTGEISGLSMPNSGHCYFTLKDANNAQISCAMFASYFSRLNFTPADGMKVTVTGCAAFYAPRGSFQLKVMSMGRQGKGDLREQLKQLYAKLYREGLFDDSHKKPLPALPRRIGVITSQTGAVIHDIINTLQRRNPHFDLLLYPAAVQGENCPVEVTQGLDYFMRHKNVDVVIVARGGGSVEDLWGFNDEMIIRKIYECDIPVISAVGHETDYTLCDYVADVRALTPTAAAEIVLDRYDDMKSNIADMRYTLQVQMDKIIDIQRSRLKYLREHRALHSPMYYVKGQRDKFNSLCSKLVYGGKTLTLSKRAELGTLRKSLDNAITINSTARKTQLTGLIDSLNLLGPANVLKRGYSYVHSKDGVIKSVKQTKVDDDINIVLSDGKITARVTSVE